MGPISKKLAARLVVSRLAVLALTASVGALGVALATADVALAKGGGGGGGGGNKGGGGGGGSKGGGGGWSGGGHASVSHFSAAHYSGGHGHYSAHISSHASHWSGGHHYSHVTHYSHTHTTKTHTNTSKVSQTNQSKTNQSKTNQKWTKTGEEKNLKSVKSDPKDFKNRRDFANKTAFNSFWHDKWHQDWWHHHHFFHIGWIGPWFWPYAYGDFFYFALWPWDYWYYDPFWAYGYGDIYEAVFFPYNYDDYVQGPRAPERMARLKQSIAQGCNEEAGEVTGWPIDQIQSAVAPDQRQSQALDDLGNAIVKASNEIRAHCPTNVAFTPTARLDQMHERLQTLVNAVDIVSPPLSSFYDSLNDEQKARFNDIAPRASRQPRGGQNGQGDLTAATIRGQCGAGMMAWPTDQIDRVVRPDDSQRAKMQALQSAAAQAADTIKAACPNDVPPTPPARLTAVGARLQAMLRGVEAMQPALADFYNSLSDDQKARFNSMGRQLFAQNG